MQHLSGSSCGGESNSFLAALHLEAVAHQLLMILGRHVVFNKRDLGVHRIHSRQMKQIHVQSAGLYCCYTWNVFLTPKDLFTYHSKYQKFKCKRLTSFQRKVSFKTPEKELTDIEMWCGEVFHGNNKWYLFHPQLQQGCVAVKNSIGQKVK